MSRMIGTVSRGLRAPIIRAGDDLAKIVTDCVLEASVDGGFSVQDRDIVAITESIVARVQGN
ncbi:MAG: coenzyme F420-0:L-glutamate ligase, partial [Oscillospiraceae bacterium]|nr:coenzyme F420-0:L-glutamate ligase [Oscillospiraceae bacterium]